MIRGGRLPQPGPLPWARPRRELLLLALVALALLPIVMPAGAQDVSRFCLTDALVHGRVSADTCLHWASDKATYHGHLYSDKAPGFSLLAIPAAEIVRLPNWIDWVGFGQAQLWAVRLSLVGLAFMLCLFMVGRVAEGLAPGWGGAALVTFGLGTVASGFAMASFGHVPAAALGFGAFVLAWSRRPLAAGLVAGTAVLVEYETGLIVLAVGAYILLTGLRPLGRYALGLVPGGLLLALYNTAAFGSPFRLSYKYVSAGFAEQQSKGFFGIHLPTAHGTHLVFAGNRGLLLNSPVLLAAAYGLFLLWRRGWRAEAAVCAVVSLAFVLVNAGYYLPYGGDSPGPRFLIPSLPFLAVGLGLAFAVRPLVTSVLAAASVVASTTVALTWATAANENGYRGSVWRELGDLVQHGTGARIAGWFQKDVLWSIGVGRLGSGGIAMTFAVAAFSLALWLGWSMRRAARPVPGVPTPVPIERPGVPTGRAESV